jgi:hydrogenase maturation protease
VITKIVCLGNELVADDAIGFWIGRVLKRLPLPPGTELQFRPNLSLDLLDIIDQNERVILVDAMSTDRPIGTCVTVHGGELERWSIPAVLAHGLCIAELVVLAKKLSAPKKLDFLYFVGIEGRAFDYYDLEPSPEVIAAIPRAVESILTLLGADQALLSLGGTESARTIAAKPTILDVLSG